MLINIYFVALKPSKFNSLKYVLYLLINKLDLNINN